MSFQGTPNDLFSHDVPGREAICNGLETLVFSLRLTALRPSWALDLIRAVSRCINLADRHRHSRPFFQLGNL